MSNKTYDRVKIVALIVIPALATMVGTLGQTWGWENVDKIVISINAISTCLGAIITKLNADYKAKQALKESEEK